MKESKNNVCRTLSFSLSLFLCMCIILYYVINIIIYISYSVFYVYSLFLSSVLYFFVINLRRKEPFCILLNLE